MPRPPVQRRVFKRALLLIILFVVAPALFVGFYSVALLELESTDGLVRLAIILLCMCTMVFGLALAANTFRREMELARMKDMFVSNVSHELKTPLATIKLLVEMLESGVKNPAKSKEYYRTIWMETERLSRLVHNILNFSRMNTGRLKHTPVKTDIGALVVTVVEQLELSLGDTAYGFVVDNRAPNAAIAISPDEVSQAIINLLENAIKYSDKAHDILIRIDETEAELTVSFKDEGIGVAPKDHRAIFEAFYRVGEDLSPSRKGTGIGLALVAGIMETHGGRVSVVSAEGVGSTFTLHFPK